MSNLIFAGNLHAGGGVQVATSFIQELALSSRDLESFDIIVSKRVNKELATLGVDVSKFGRFRVYDFFGIKRPKKFSYDKQYNTCFVVFGPVYHKIPAHKLVVGFAQPWIAYPYNDAYPLLSFKERLKNKVKFAFQSFLFKRYDELVVEHQHVKDALLENRYTNSIHVVSNTINDCFLKGDDDEADLAPLFPTDCKGKLKLGFIGRNYVHKNLKILGEVNEILIREYDLCVDFIFTLNDSEMDQLGFSEIDNFYSVGEIGLIQCPGFYKKLDGVIFPSLLECFSATPLEAMQMSVPLLSSAYPFITSVCKDSALYFDATDADSIAQLVFYFSENDVERQKRLSEGKRLASLLPSSRDRADRYVDIIG
ncbi:glycosyltransferase [Vibrio campbellii]